MKQIDEFRYLIPRTYKNGMRVEGMVYADEELIGPIERDQTLDQVANVATLPGLVGRSLAMPDAHQGYGFCIGGVAAADPDDGVVSAGGVGFDINCGVRLLATPFREAEISDRMEALLNQMFRDIPCGTGRKGQVMLGGDEIDEVLADGAAWAVRQGYGREADLARLEEFGRMSTADPEAVSERAKARGRQQLGTLGSGNHFLEIQRVDQVFLPEIAERFGLKEGNVCVLIHSGSRGLGHQVCTDALHAMDRGMAKYGIRVIDRQLACVPVRSAEGEEYLGGMAAAANFAFANRQMMTHWVREGFERVIGRGRIDIVYDVCHNIAKFEEHEVDGSQRTVLVHRKGATRALPPGHPLLPDELSAVGQPVLIPGSMGTSSYVLVGTDQVLKETFGSSCHGAGRAKSRSQAKRETAAGTVRKELKEQGILVRCESKAGLTEEKPDAYKDVSRVVDVVEGAGIAKKVVRLLPRAVMKG